MSFGFHQENHSRGVGDAVVWQSLLPISYDETAVVMERIDVGLKTQRNNVSLQSVDDRSGLFCRAAVRLLNCELVAGLLLVLLAERLVELLV
jgi:hypothetical protein